MFELTASALWTHTCRDTNAHLPKCATCLHDKATTHRVLASPATLLGLHLHPPLTQEAIEVR